MTSVSLGYGVQFQSNLTHLIVSKHSGLIRRLYLGAGLDAWGHVAALPGVTPRSKPFSAVLVMITLLLWLVAMV